MAKNVMHAGAPDTPTMTRKRRAMLGVAQSHLRRCSTKQRWVQQTLEMALLLMRAYFTSDAEGIAAAEEPLAEDVIRETRMRFTMTCIKQGVHDVPGQRTDWYDEVAASTQKFLDSRRRRFDAKPATKNASADPDTEVDVTPGSVESAELAEVAA